MAELTRQQKTAIRLAKDAFEQQRAEAALLQQGVSASEIQTLLKDNPDWASGNVFDMMENLFIGSKRTEYPEIPELNEQRLLAAGVPDDSEMQMTAQGRLVPSEPSRFAGEAVNKFTAAKATSEDDWQVANVLMDALGGDEGVGFWQDYHGNTVVTIDGEDFYLNKPGISWADMERLASQLVMYTAGSKLWMRGNMLKRIGLAGAQTTAIAGARDVGQWALGGTIPEPDRVMMIGGLAALGVPVFTYGGLGAAKVWELAKPWFKGGNLSQEAVQAIQNAGLDPSKLEAPLRRWFMRQEDKYGVEGATTKLTQATLPPELVVPLTAGETTGRVGIQQAESLIEQGGRGQTAQDIALLSREAQDVRLQGTPDTLLASTGSRTSPARGEALDTLQLDLRAIKSRDYKTYKMYFGEADRGSSFIPSSDVAVLRDSVANISPAGSLEATPVYGTAMTMLDNQMAKVGASSGTPAGAKVGDLFQWRKEVTRMRNGATDKSDKEALRMMIYKFDSYIDDLIRRGEAIADPMNVVWYRDAVNLRRQFGERWEAVKPRDPNYLVSRVVGDDGKLLVSSEEAANILFNASDNNWMAKPLLNQGLVEIKRRLGAYGGGRGWLGIKDEVMLRLIANATKTVRIGKTIDSQFNPRQMLKDWLRLKKNKPQLFSTLFTVEDQSLVNRFLFQASRAGYKKPIAGASGSNVGGVFATMFGRPFSRIWGVGMGKEITGAFEARNLFQKGQPPTINPTPRFSLAGSVVPATQEIQEAAPQAGWAALWPFQNIGQQNLGERGGESGLK